MNIKMSGINKAFGGNPVLRDAGFDPNTCSGFAFGVGLERVAMLKFGIDDIRNFYINDLRFNHYFDRFE